MHRRCNLGCAHNKCSKRTERSIASLEIHIVVVYRFMRSSVAFHSRASSSPSSGDGVISVCKIYPIRLHTFTRKTMCWCAFLVDCAIVHHWWWVVFGVFDAGELSDIFVLSLFIGLYEMALFCGKGGNVLSRILVYELKWCFVRFHKNYFVNE